MTAIGKAIAGVSRPRESAARARYHHGNLREALLEAGLAHLEKSGAEAISLREMARQVGVAPNAVYRHFASKESLLVVLASEGFRILRATQDQAILGAASPISAMKRCGLAYIRFACANPALFRLMFGRFTSSQCDPELTHAMRDSFEQLCAAVAAASKLELADPRAQVRAIHALALAHGLSHLHLDGQIADWVGDAATLTEAVLEAALGMGGTGEPPRNPRHGKRVDLLEANLHR